MSGRRANEERKRVLKLRALHAQADELGLNRGEERLRLRDVEPTGYAAGVASLGQLKSLLKQVYIALEDFAIRIHVAKRQIILGDVRFQRKKNVLVIGFGGLILGARGFGGPPDPAPEIDFVVQIHGKIESVVGVRSGDKSRRILAGAGIPLSQGRWVERDSRVQIGARDTKLRACLRHTRHRGLQRRIVHHRLRFEFIQFGIAEHFPPIALGDRVVWRRRLPARGRSFLK